MCNWCINKITIRGKDLKRLDRHFIKSDEKNEPYFDFNTIIEMPKELDIEKSSRTHDGFLLYLASINPSIPSFGEASGKLSHEEFGKLLLIHHPETKVNMEKYILKPYEIEEIKSRYGDSTGEVIALGKQALENLIRYGSSDWYDWRLEHWGTKWNACNSYHSDDYAEIYFDTAWDPSIPVIEELAKMYPDLEFTHEWAEEQTGWYSGKYTYRGGALVEALDYETDSKEAYELSFELWGDGSSYRFNEDTGTYEYIEEE